jgi:FixJ family two-component response regulator
MHNAQCAPHCAVYCRESTARPDQLIGVVREEELLLSLRHGSVIPSGARNLSRGRLHTRQCQRFLAPLGTHAVQCSRDTATAEGLRNKEIAARLSITERTAAFHVGNVLSKLGADGRVEAIHFARPRGLI